MVAQTPLLKQLLSAKPDAVHALFSPLLLISKLIVAAKAVPAQIMTCCVKCAFIGAKAKFNDCGFSRVLSHDLVLPQIEKFSG